MLTRAEAEDFLFHEARLLDERRFEEWLGLFAPAGVYWVPIREDASPDTVTSLVHDEAVRRRERVYRLLRTPAQAQTPPSRTRHCITNVRVEDGPNGDVRIYSNQIVYEVRPVERHHLSPGDGQQAFVGGCEHHLARERGRWLILLKKVVLLNRDLPIGNLTFIL